MDNEPTLEEIREFMRNFPGESFYTARERLRDEAYRKTHKKPAGMSWGDYWKTY